MSSEITGGIRRSAEPQRKGGYKAPSTAGLNSGDPTLKGRVPATAPVGGNARAFPQPIHRHEERGWHELHAVEMRGYTETLVDVELGNGETLLLDPRVAQIWRVTVNGSAAKTIQLPDLDDEEWVFPEPETARQDDPARKRTWSCVLMIDYKQTTAAGFPDIVGARWSEGRTEPYLLMPDGEEPSSYAGVYMFTFVADPVAQRVFGLESGSRF